MIIKLDFFFFTVRKGTNTSTSIRKNLGEKKRYIYIYNGHTGVCVSWMCVERDGECEIRKRRKKNGQIFAETRFIEVTTQGKDKKILVNI